MYNNKAIFFDRDGVINKLVKRNNGFFSPRKYSEFDFHKDIKSCIDYLLKNNFLIFVVSNQPDISRKKMSINELDKIDREINEKLHVDEIYYSFDDKYSINGSKKPSPKMLFDAKEKWKIDFSRSYFIGDSIVDEECAKNANVSFILVSRNHNKELNSSLKVSSLDEIKYIIS